MTENKYIFTVPAKMDLTLLCPDKEPKNIKVNGMGKTVS